MSLRNCKLRVSTMMLEGLTGSSRFYRSNPKADLKKLRPMILKRIEDRAKDYPVNSMVPVAEDVLKAITLLIQGVSTLLQVYSVWACKHCPEVYIGEKGHLIRNCGDYRHRAKNQIHDWIKGTLNDIIILVETFHLHKMFQILIKHNQRFDFDRIPAVIELCLQAGVDPNDKLYSNNLNLDNSTPDISGANSLSPHDLRLIGRGTLRAWEAVRLGVHKLLLVYPSKVCKYCLEVHVGPSGHKARLCGVFKYENWRGSHFWKKAEVDDLVPPKVVWFHRPQDPHVLVDEGQDYYGHAPTVVDLCTKAGLIAPSQYFCLMKVQGILAPV